jgi:molecular chaperone DnaK
MDSVGIDLGTTNTVICRDRQVLSIVRGGVTARSLGSCVAYMPSGKLITGAAARQRAPIDPENTIVSAKRILGQSWESQAVTEYRQRYGSKMMRDPVRGPVFQTRAGPKTPVDVAAIVLESALRGAGLDPGNTRAIITVPAAFTADQRAATEAAGLQAGLAKVALLEEPVATALAHGAVGNAKYSAVYDIGGGTFDLCVLDCTLYPIGILGHGGDLFLGGDDFDEAIAADIAATLLREYQWDLRTNNEAFRRLVGFAEQAKIELSTSEVVNLELNEVDPAMPVVNKWLSVDRSTVARACFNIVRRTFATCDTVFGDIDLSRGDIDRLFLAGGASQMPLVRSWVTAYFGIEPSRDVAPFEVVALGASIAAQEAFAGS